MKKCLLLMAIALTLAFISCNSTHDSESQIVKIDYDLDAELTKKHFDALALDSAERLCVDKINAFAFSLLHHIAKDKDSSFVIAPLSLASALAVAGNGADGVIRDSLEQMLGPITNANAFYKRYMAALPHNDYSDCLMLNYLAVNTDAPIKDVFSKTVSSYYNACVKKHDFADTKVIKKINDWFHQQSLDDTIRVIEKLDTTLSLCLINALEFNALWFPFDEECTLLRDFITDKGDTLRIPIMSNTEEIIPYVDREGFQAVTIPYFGSCYRMMIVLPKTEKLATFSQSMTLESFNGILDSFHESTEVVLDLPRFKCESDLFMMDFLKKLLPSVFDNKIASFNAIIDDPLNSHVISEIDHKTCIEVNELGTKAYSVTDEFWMTLSIKPKFIANHPFLYFVYDEATRAILLMGQFCGDGALFHDGDRPIEELYE